MYSIGKIISENRKKKKMSQITLAQTLNARYDHDVSNKSVSKWETDCAEPSLTVFFDICRLLGVTDPYGAYFGVKESVGFSELTDPYDSYISGLNITGLNAEGKARLSEYASLLSGDSRFRKAEAADQLSEFSADAGRFGQSTPPEVTSSSSSGIIPMRSRRMIPMQLYPVSAGPGNFLDDENYEDIPVDESVPSCVDFAVRVSGDSMMPLLTKNQIIYVHRQSTLESGEIGIFFLDGEAYVKKFQSGHDGTALISLNSKYAPIPVTDQSDFRIFGKVIM